MNLARLLLEREAAGNPVRVGLVGAGKFGGMYLTQARRTRGVHVVGVADLDPDRARATLSVAGWEPERYGAASFDEARRAGTLHVTDDAGALIRDADLEVLIEATGHPGAGIGHCRAALAAGLHVVMVTVEADVVAGPLLAREARDAGVVYSLAWGDQPALVCEHVDWARACGFEVVAAGKGTRYHPSYHASTPESVWEVLEQYLDITDRSTVNPKMFNSFIDGTKSGIEMSAVCNATGLVPQSGGLGFPPSTRFELAEVCKPRAEGGTLEHGGTTEVVSSVYRDGRNVPHDLAMGTYVVIESDGEYASRCFREYHMLEDGSGRYAALYRPTHMIGMELGISVASAALRGEPTGAPTGFRADVVATAKRALTAGEILDGEGGCCVWGKQMPAGASLAMGGLPLGLAADAKLLRDVAEGEQLTWDDVEVDATDEAVVARRDMEREFGNFDPAA